MNNNTAGKIGNNVLSGPNMGGSDVQHAKDPRGTLRRMMRYFRPHIGLMTLAFIFSIISNLCALVLPRLSGDAIDAILPGNVDLQTVIKYAILMMGLAVFSALISWLLSAALVRVSRGIVHSMRRDLFERLTCLPVRFYDTYQAGDIISVLSYDVDTVGASVATDLTQILSSVITVIGSLFMMIGISPKLMLVFVFTIPASILFTRYRSKKVHPLFRRRSVCLGRMNGYAEETVSGMKTIRAYNQENEFNNRFRVYNEEASLAQQRADGMASSTGPTVNFISNISVALVSVFGVFLFMNGGITLGGVSSFVLYSRKFSGPINEFANLLGDLQSTLAAAERVMRLLDLAPETPDRSGAKSIEDCRGEVCFRDVRFGYLPDKEVLHGLNFTVRPGETVAIVGETGCGKTTMINLLMRFYDVASGAILLDGTDIRDITRDSLRKQFTMVLQDTWLFDGTIEENLAYGSREVTHADIEAAARAAHVHDMIMAMEDGYGTRLSDSGNHLSKGQKQLLTIARAMLVPSRILILDEATSNVDTQTERLIRDAMLSLMNSKTCFVIAHRLSTITGADRIFVMDSGRIVETGKHTELLARNGVYAELYRAQFDAVTQY